nr:hypothetical protein Iba_chr10fCG9970 [Ipomoea batatas]
MAWCRICIGSLASPLSGCRFRPCFEAHLSPPPRPERQNGHGFLQVYFDWGEIGTDFLAEIGGGSDFLAGKSGGSEFVGDFLAGKCGGSDFLAESGGGSEFVGDFLAGKCGGWGDGFQDWGFLDGCGRKCNGFVIRGFGGEDCVNLGLLVLRLSVFLILLFLVGQRGSEGNGANHEIEEDEENCGSEPAIHGFPDG